jgi:hypothetical protein
MGFLPTGLLSEVEPTSTSRLGHERLGGPAAYSGAAIMESYEPSALGKNPPLVGRAISPVLRPTYLIERQEAPRLGYRPGDLLRFRADFKNRRVERG